jgi:superfamily II DNA/RNA helicase
MGFIDDVERISDAVPDACQTLLFAATVGADTTRLAKKLMKNPERVEVAPGKITVDKIEQRLHLADNLEHKNRLLQHLCADSAVTKAIIFSATKRDADVLARDLNRQGHAAAALHGDMTQYARNRTMVNMRRGKIKLLVATDVAARGIDLTGVSHVINFDLPRFAEDYVHRIGRTGRAGESGIAISLASRMDLPYLDRIEKYIGQSLTAHIIPGLEPTLRPHTRDSERNNSRRPHVAVSTYRGPKGKSPGRPFSYQETGGATSHPGSRPGRTKHSSDKRDWEVTVEYRSGKSDLAGHSGNRKSGRKLYT